MYVSLTLRVLPSHYCQFVLTIYSAGNGETCQTMIFDIEGSCSNVDVYNLNTIGATSMINRNGQSLANYADNVNVFPDTIALFRSN